jgi:hypothetical protein
MSVTTYDPASYELAEHFLQDEPCRKDPELYKKHCHSLALDIQQAVEDWFYEDTLARPQRSSPAIGKERSMSEPDNLTKDYPQEFLELWDGCSHLDCLLGCRIGLENGYCVRLEKAFAEFNAAAPANSPAIQGGE